MLILLVGMTNDDMHCRRSVSHFECYLHVGCPLPIPQSGGGVRSWISTSVSPSDWEISAIARGFARRPVHPDPHDTVGLPA